MVVSVLALSSATFTARIQKRYRVLFVEVSSISSVASPFDTTAYGYVVDDGTSVSYTDARRLPGASLTVSSISSISFAIE